MEVAINVKEDHPYFPLAQVFEAAFNQASAGKGNERHAYSSDENYRNQLICEMDRRLHGNADGPKYQAVKKIYESARMDPDRAIKELLGAINYTAAAIILLDEKRRPQENKPQKKEPEKSAEDTEPTNCKTCPLNMESEKEKPKDKTDIYIEELFDENFGVDQSAASRVEIGE